LHLDFNAVVHHDAVMRTTITLDADVTRLVEEEIHRTRSSFKEVVNDALRRSLGGSAVAEASEPYRVRPHKTALLPGLDRGRFNALADELEDSAVLATRMRSAAAKRTRRAR
jgi:Arc/MetJ family transcription regulator